MNSSDDFLAKAAASVRALRKPNPDPQRLSLFALARALGLNVGGRPERGISPFRRRGYTAPRVGAVTMSWDGVRQLPVPHGVARALKARG